MTDADARRPAPARHATGEAVGGARRTAEDDPPHHRHPAAPSAESLLPRCPHHPARTRPDSAEWYHGANLILRTDACLIGARYRQLRNQGLASGEALVFAYRAYQAATLPPYRISLDRAFNLVSYIDGIWLANAPALSVLTCPECGCEFIAAVGTVAHPGEPCPFCKLLERFHLDHRIQASYPARPALWADRLGASSSGVSTATS